MKTCIKNKLIQFGRLLASIALLLAVCSVNSTCVFMTYQPDIPEMLK